MGYHVVYHSLSVAFCSLLNDKEKQLLSVKTFISEKFCDEIQASRLPGMNRLSSKINLKVYQVPPLHRDLIILLICMCGSSGARYLHLLQYSM